MKKTIMIGTTYTARSVTGHELRRTVLSLKTIGTVQYAQVRDADGCEFMIPVAALGTPIADKFVIVSHEFGYPMWAFLNDGETALRITKNRKSATVFDSGSRDVHELARAMSLQSEYTWTPVKLDNAE